MPWHWRWLAIVGGLCLSGTLSSSRLAAQSSTSDSLVLAVSADSSMRQLIKLRDGSTVLGRITQSWGDSARVESTGGTFVVRRNQVSAVKLIAASSIHDGVYWPEDPNSTRLFFGPTGRVLRKGEGYISNHWIFLVDGYAGITDRFTLGGAMSILPSDNILKNNVYFISPKFALTQSERLNTAVGVWVGAAPFSKEVGAVNSFGIAYGVATWGGRDGTITFGGGYGFAEGKLARNPVVMLGGTRRISRRVSLVTENWLFPNVNHPLISGGIRTHGENLSWDFGLITVPGSGNVLVPWFGAAWKF